MASHEKKVKERKAPDTRIIECTIDRLVTEYSDDSWSTSKEFISRVAAPIAIAFTVVLVPLYLITMSASIFFSIMMIIIEAGVCLALIILSYFGTYYRRYEVDKVKREVNVTTLRHNLKESHETITFEQISNVEAWYYKGRVHVMIAVKKGGDMVLYIGYEPGTVLDFVAYLRELFLHVQFKTSQHS
nr:hypothetical protein [Candidatus Sigynarchaeota archaeon]